jgi:radical SAM superfamily enzyme YgiQ (UPF0313 family)
VKILLVTIKSQHTIFSITKNKKKFVLYPPIGLLYIAAVLEEKGHKVELVDYLYEENPLETIKKYLPNTDLVGISLYTQGCDQANQLIKIIKQHDPDIPIIIGGPHCVFFPDDALVDVPGADIMVETEGETVINNIIETLVGDNDFSKLHGIRYRKNNEIRKGKKPLVISDLDSVPFPSRHLVEKYDYGRIGEINFFKQKFTSLLTSRGCPFKCRFCTRHISSIENYRRRSAENVINEFIEINMKYESALIVDDNFLADKKRVHKILDGIIENGIDMEISIDGARVDSADRDLYKKMKKAGVTSLHFGLESGNQDVLDFYRKETTLPQIRKAIDLCDEMDFYSIGSFILGAPIETERHIEQTIKFACSLPLNFAVFFPLGFQRGSDLWIEAVKNGKFNEDLRGTLADSRIGIGNFTSDELVNFCKKATKRFYYRPGYISKQILRCIRERDFNFFKIGLETL